MTVVDRHGRLFGRLNLVDAVVLLLVIALVPLAFGAYTMFRAPLPELTGIEPTTVQSGPNLRVTVRGENLRPYMRVSFGDWQGVNFLFQNTTTAHVDLGDIPPGEYDVVLYDHAQERGRLPGGLSVKPSPLPDSQLIVVGSFGNLEPSQASRISAGMTIAGVGEVVKVGRRLPSAMRVQAGSGTVEVPGEANARLPAMIRMGCFLRVVAGVPQCQNAGVTLQPTAILMFNTDLGNLPFQVDEVRGTQPVESVRAVVRFVGPRQLVTQIRQGDVDLGPWRNELAAGARVVRLTQRDISGDVVERDVELELDAQRGSSGWIYAAAPLRTGTALTLRTDLYQLQGTILTLEPSPRLPGETP